MRKTVLIAALLLVSASAQAGQSRNLSLAGSSSHPPISAPLPPTPANVIAEAPPAITQPAPVAVAPAPIAAPAPVAQPAPAPVTAAPETGAPPVATAPVPPPLPPAPPVTTATPAAAPATEAPKYVERPTVAPTTSDTKVDDGKPSRRAERRHRGGGWTAGRIMGELQRYGISYGYSW